MSTRLTVLSSCAAASLLYLCTRKPRGYDDPLRWRPSKSVADVEAANKRWLAALQAQGRTDEQYLIVGAGSLGCRLALALLLRGERRIRFLDIRESPILTDLIDESQKRFPGSKLEFLNADVTRPEQLVGPCKGVGTVFCTFAAIRFWERLECHREISHKINVQGTRNVVEACQAAGVRQFVHTSTSNVSLQWKHILSPENPPVLDETTPYVTESTRLNHYGTSKAAAEKLVLEANGSSAGQFVTGSIRPCSAVFGDRDAIGMDMILKDKWMPCMFPAARADNVYMDNVVWGHLLLEKELRSKNAAAVGQVFAVTNQQPVTMREYLHGVQHYYPELVISYPPALPLLCIGYVVEFLSRFMDTRRLGSLQLVTPPMRNVAGASYTYTDAKAERILGYSPMFTLDEAMLNCVLEYKARTMGK